MAALNRQRAQTLMRGAGVDALVLFQPENFTYATGASPGVAAMWRRGGASIAIAPSDPDAKTAAIIGDLNLDNARTAAPDVDFRPHRIWVDTVDVTGLPRDGRPAAALLGEAYRCTDGGVFRPRPATFDISAVFQLLGDLLAEKGLSRGRLAADLEFLPVTDYRALESALSRVAWSDGSAIVRRLRAIKSPAEIDFLRRGCALAETGLVAMAHAIASGRSRRDLSRVWRSAIDDTAEAGNVRDLTGVWDFISVGADPWVDGGTVAEGAIVKADVGCVVSGYSSDSARTYVFGRPDSIARDIFAVLTDAFHAGLETIRPGTVLRDVYAATARVMHAAGFHGYQRGHFGHGLGASVGSEEWPFIAADSEVVVEPGMVLAFETPFYGSGIGALMIEDQMLVTETGINVMNKLPRALVEIG